MKKRILFGVGAVKFRRKSFSTVIAFWEIC